MRFVLCSLYFVLCGLESEGHRDWCFAVLFVLFRVNSWIVAPHHEPTPHELTRTTRIALRVRRGSAEKGREVIDN